MKTTWTQFKNLIDSVNLLPMMIEDDTVYELKVNHDGNSYDCRLFKDDGNEVVDFETNYLIKCNQPLIRDELGRKTVTLAAIPYKDNLRLRYTGIEGTAIAGTTTAIEYKVPEDRRLNGSQLFLRNHVFGDYLTFKVIDKDNVLGYGYNVILDIFATKFWVDPDNCGQGQYLCSYSALLIKDLYVVIEYTSVGQTNVDVKAVFQMHKVN